jgi:NHL repeat
LYGVRERMRLQAPGEWAKLPVVLALTLVLVLGIGISLALAGKGIESWFGQQGSAAGQFQTPRDVAVYNGTAVNPGTRHIYVVDDNNHRIQQFDSNGVFIRTWGGGVDDGTAVGQTCTADCQAGVAGTAEGMFDNPQGVAINQETGAVYVRDRDNLRVQQFNADGSFVRAWGWGVATGAAAFEVCTTTCQAGATGGGAGQFATSATASNGIAVAPGTGDVFVADPTNRRVQQFAPDGAFVKAWGWGVDTGASAFEVCTAASGCQAGLTTAGTENGRFGANHPVHIGVDSNGVVYASDSNSLNRVMRFDSTQATATALLLTPIGAPPLASAATNSIEVDPSSDNVLVGRGVIPGSASIQELGTTPLRVVDTHLTSTPLVPTGIGIDTSDGEILVSSISTFEGTAHHRVYVLDTVPIDAVISPVTDITSNSATFNGSVDPNGFPTTARFEYTSDPPADPDPEWKRAPGGTDIDIGNGSDPVPLSLAVAPLEPETDYRVRVVASRGTPLGGNVISPETTFSTVAATPTIVSTGATPGSTTATLRGDIHPQGQATTYRFEYGLTDSYGSAVPVPDGDAGSGTTVLSVEESISGLAPNTTYHFRLVAANTTGQTAGPDGTFTTLSLDPGADRGYEKVSPEDKNGGDTQGTGFGQTGFASPSGDAVVYTASQPFDDAEGTTQIGSVYRARRQSTTWASTPVLPPKGPTADANDGSEVDFMSEDLSRALVKTNVVLDAGALPEECNLYLRDLDARTYEFIAHADPATTNTCSRSISNIVVTDASPDLSGVLIETRAELTADADAVPLENGQLAPKLYHWQGGQLELASVAAGGPPAGTPTRGSAGVDGINDFIDNAISDDGSVAYFTGWDIVGHPPPQTATANLTLYRRAGGTTVAVSREENSLQDPCGPAGAVCVGNTASGPVFGAASADGSRVFFTSAHQLVEEDVTASGRDLYMYTHSANPDVDENLTLLSRDLEPAAPDGADVVGVLGASDDGSRVYFAARNQIVAGEDSSPADLRFYVWDEAEGIRYIGGGLSITAFRTADAEVASQVQRTRAKRSVSANGNSLIFMSSIRLTDDGDPQTPGDDNGGQPQAYLYDFGADQLVCASCPRVASLGAPGTGSSLRARDASNVLADPGPRVLSDDGTRAFFETDSRLVPADANGLVDVYMWERGEPHLISTGQSGDRSLFIDASASGDAVVLGTREQLVPWDTDNLRDTYVARVDGGLPDPRPPAGAPCQGDECQGRPAGLPALLAPVSDLLRGLGDVALGPRADFALRRLSKAQLSKLARGGRVMLPVRVNRAGKVSLTARAMLGDSRRVVAKSSKRAKRAGTVGVPLRLSKAALRELARERRLRVSLSVRFSGVREPGKRTLSLRRAKASANGGGRGR